jgi:hypothetical protein
MIYVTPGRRPEGWSKINHTMTRAEVYQLIGQPTYIDTEAMWEIWYGNQFNGRWSMQVRFDQGKISSGDYSFHNQLWDSEWNPLPRPFSRGNFTTADIP